MHTQVDLQSSSQVHLYTLTDYIDVMKHMSLPIVTVLKWIVGYPHNRTRCTVDAFKCMPENIGRRDEWGKREKKTVL